MRKISTNMRKVFQGLAILILLPLGAAQAQMPDFASVTIKTTNLGHGLYMLEGLGGNIGVSVGADGVFVIDDQFAPLAQKILAAIAEISDKPVKFVINTHWHQDHTGGNEQLGALGAIIIAQDNVRARMAAVGPKQSPPGALPIITFSQSVTFHYNGHEIHAFHPPAAHTDGDAVIHFRTADVIHAGDVLWNGYYPFIDLASGGSVNGAIAALEKLAAMAGPNTKIIPGHGPLANLHDLNTALAMLKDARQRVAELIAQGRTLAEIQDLDPLSDYNQAWGNFFITGPRMVEILYEGLRK